jgi:transcriptional regulator with PAS, ATPase and Fis domain
MHLILFLDINILYTSIVLLFNLFIPYVFFYISHASNMPFANFPLASKLILKLLRKFFNIDIGTTNRSITRSGTSILIDFLDTIPELVWCKDQVNRYKYVNSATCKTLLMLDREVVEGKTAKEIANHLRTKNIRYTFSEICYDSDEYTKEQKKPCTFYEYGYIGEKYIALHILKIPIFKDDNVMGTIALAREVTTLINQQTTIEQLFLNGNIEEGINKFLQYHQQFKSVKNVHLDIN